MDCALRHRKVGSAPFPDDEKRQAGSQADACWALAASDPAQSDGRQHAHSCSGSCPGRSDIPQSDDKRHAGKDIQGAHRTSPERGAASPSAMIPFPQIVQAAAGILRSLGKYLLRMIQHVISLSKASRSRPAAKSRGALPSPPAPALSDLLRKWRPAVIRAGAALSRRTLGPTTKFKACCRIPAVKLCQAAGAGEI
jgi:hypothetical protein